MATLTLDKPEVIRSHANLLKERAAEALDDSLRVAKRTAKQRLNELEDLKDDAAIRVRKAPLAAVAVTFAAGLLFGLAVGWFSHRPTRA